MLSQRVGVAMSGGVDSTATALMLSKKHRLRGFFMDLGQPDIEHATSTVERIAASIGIEYEVIDLKRAFQERVLSYFSDHYFSGLTPNPCMICNHSIKFGLFLETILSSGMSIMATGHYARIQRSAGDFSLHTGIDPRKDQSYFLARLTQKQLASIIFPLGSMKKDDIFDYVEQSGHTGFRGSESQDVCFLKEQSVTSYLEQFKEAKRGVGKIVTTEGDELGTHQGLYRYTIGQRRGLGISDSTPWYVSSLDYNNNNLVVGKESDLFSTTLKARSPHWIGGAPPLVGTELRARIRSTHSGSPAVLTMVDDQFFCLKFNSPQRAIAPGQFAVLYDRDRVVGSGEIVTANEKSNGKRL